MLTSPPMHERSAKLKMAIKVSSRPFSQPHNPAIGRQPCGKPNLECFSLRPTQIRDEYRAVRNMPPPEIQPKKKRAGDDERGNRRRRGAGPASVDAAIPYGRGEGCEEGQGDGHLQADRPPLTTTRREKRRAPAPTPSSSSRARPERSYRRRRSGTTTARRSSRGSRASGRSPPLGAPWKLYRVISGHLGWVRSVTVDPSNEWFATGSADRTIKIWDLASGQLKLTLTVTSSR